MAVRQPEGKKGPAEVTLTTDQVGHGLHPFSAARQPELTSSATCDITCTRTVQAWKGNVLENRKTMRFQATDLVLHWGVRTGKNEWVLPPEQIWPQDSVDADGKALDSPFVSDAGSEHQLEVGGEKVQLQTLRLRIPPDSKFTGLTFVLRSGDNSAWFRDGGPCSDPGVR